MSDTNSILKNSENIKDIADFVNHKNAIDNNVFVCIIGEDDYYKKDIINMDKTLRATVAYNRISALPPLPPDKSSFYEDKYNNWLRSFKRKAVTGTTIYNEKQSEILSAALIQTLDIFRKSRKQITDSIEKNFAMKLLFWYDFATEDIVNDSHISNGIKIVGENAVKIQEYLFFYMMSLTGADVLLLQNKADLELPVKNLNLSARSILGHLGTTDIPKFTRIHTNARINPRQNTAAPAVNSSTNIRTAAPQRQSSYSQPQPQSSGNVRVTIPPRPGRQTYSQPVNNIPQRQSSYPQSSGNVRVTIPPRPGRQTYSQPVNNVPQRQSSYPQSQPQSTGSIRLTVPPRPGRQTYPQPVNNVPQGQSSYNRTPPISSSNAAPSQPAIIRQPNRQQNSIYSPMNARISPQPRVEKSYEELARLASSVVQIFGITGQSSNSDRFQIVGSGSGIMIADSGYILTNNHVARASHKYAVRIENDDKVYFTNRLVKYHSDFDLAIIQIERKLTPLPIYRGPQPLVRGQKVVAIGSPEGLFNTVSDGIISGFRTINGVDMIQFTAPISNGSSGGAILNMYGEVIGISTSGFDEGQNINFAVGYEIILNFTRGITMGF